MLLHCLCNLRRLSWAQSYTTKITLISSQKPEQIFWTSPTSVEIELCTIIHKLLWGQYQLTPKTIHQSIWISARRGPQKLLGLHALISVKATRREVLNHWACFIRVISTYTLEMNTDVLEERSLTFTAEIQEVRVHKYLHHLQINVRQFSSFSGAALVRSTPSAQRLQVASFSCIFPIYALQSYSEGAWNKKQTFWMRRGCKHDVLIYLVQNHQFKQLLYFPQAELDVV